MTDTTRRLIEHLGTNFIGLADCPEMRQILEICLSEQEAALMLCLSHPPVVHGVGHIARKAGLPPQPTGRLLTELAARGLIARTTLLGRDLYSLLPLMPGFYELTFMKRDTYPEHKEQLRALWTRYKKNYLAHEVSDYDTPTVRVVAARTELPVEHRVFPHDDVLRIIDRAGSRAIGLCACREAVGGCDKPIEVCMLFDQIADLLVAGGFARRASTKELQQALHASEEAGLVHCAMNCQRGVQILCNCCGCCCNSLYGVVELRKHHGVAVSSFEARIDPLLCQGCGECLEDCWTNAIEPAGEHYQVAAEDCLGCGLCGSRCPSNAIDLVPRTSPPAPTPHNPVTLTARMAQERGKTEALAKAWLKEVR